MPPEIVSGALPLIYISQWVSVQMRLKTTWETKAPSMTLEALDMAR